MHCHRYLNCHHHAWQSSTRKEWIESRLSILSWCNSPSSPHQALRSALIVHKTKTKTETHARNYTHRKCVKTRKFTFRYIQYQDGRLHVCRIPGLHDCLTAYNHLKHPASKMITYMRHVYANGYSRIQHFSWWLQPAWHMAICTKI